MLLFVTLDWQYISVPLTKCVVHFVYGEAQVIIGIEGVVDSERIEDESKQPRIAEHEDAPDWLAGLGTARQPPGIFADAGSVTGAMVAVMDAEDIEAIVAEQAETPAECGQFIHIGKQIEDAVAQFMAQRLQALVRHSAVIKT